MKSKIQESKSDLLAERQKLIHSGKVLKDEQSVSELGISESDFIVCMITKEVAKVTCLFIGFCHKITFVCTVQKTAPTPAPVAPTPVAPTPVPAAPVAVTPAPTVHTQPPAAPVAAAAASQFETAEGVAALTGMGFPETESRAALNAAYGNADLAYEYLLTGIPERARVPNTANRQAMQAAASTPVAAPAGGIEQLRNHPQFNMLKQLVQQNPAQLPQVLDLIGQQDPALLAAIHANNDTFIAMMNEPVVDTPPAAAVPAFGAAGAQNPLADPTQMIQMLGTMAPAQRAQFAQTLGMTPAQLEGFMQMMANMPPDQLQQMLAGAGAAGGEGGADAGNVIRLTAEEMESVNRLMALGFSQQEAAQAYIACDKNEGLAANLLLEGGWMDDEDGYGGGGHDDDMYH